MRQVETALLHRALIALTLLMMMFTAACRTIPTAVTGETSTPTPTASVFETFEPTPTEPPPQDAVQPDDRLARFAAGDYGIAFDYPAVFDESPYKEAGCGVGIAEDGDVAYLYVGHRIIIAISPSGGQGLEAHVDDFIEARELTLTDRTRRVVASEAAIRLEYRFGGSNRFGLVTFFTHGEWLYGVSITAGAFCEMLAPEGTADLVYTEFQTYDLILDSFEFIR